MATKIVASCPNCGSNQFMVVGNLTYTGYVDAKGCLHLTTDDKPYVESDVDCIGCGKSFPIDAFEKVSIEQENL